MSFTGTFTGSEFREFKTGILISQLIFKKLPDLNPGIDRESAAQTKERMETRRKARMLIG